MLGGGVLAQGAPFVRAFAHGGALSACGEIGAAGRLRGVLRILAPSVFHLR